MNQHFFYKNPYPLILLVSIIFFSCQKDLPNYANIDNYSFENLDVNGGRWITTILTSPDQINIDQPQDITSDTYKQELEETRQLALNASQADLDEAMYWGNNPILRWNEIARILAAKYNLTPAPNEKGEYPLPNPAKPDQYPYFPFAHPPYAARAFAYLGVAQMDALVAAWHFKYKYNRPAINIEGNKVNFPKNDLPSYPSDGAVISAVSREILGAMFPLEKAYLAERDAAMKKSLQIAGIHVKSDIIAGDSLGRGIAKLFLKRAGSDGMKSAQAPNSDSIKAIAFAKYGWQWDNMESPRRPVGIAPYYGKVKFWNVPSVEIVRPEVPPAIGSEAYQKSVDELIDIAENMTKEKRAIANFWADGLGTYTPPGHWNRIASELIVQYKLNPLRSARVLAYVNMAVQDAGISCWDAKYHYFYPRPINVIPGFKTILGTPNFPGYTSGHSSFSAAGAAVLGYIFPNEKAKLDALAKDASDSRIYGGIHFRFDCEVGLLQGKKVAEYTIQKAMADGAN